MWIAWCNCCGASNMKLPWSRPVQSCCPSLWTAIAVVDDPSRWLRVVRGFMASRKVGFHTDDYILALQAEKGLEAPLSFMIQYYTVFRLTSIVSFFSVLCSIPLSIYSMSKFVYVQFEFCIIEAIGRRVCPAMRGRRATHDVWCRSHLIPWLIAWLMLAWSFGGSLWKVALTCFKLPVRLFTCAVNCFFEQALNWLHQELMIIWTIGHLFISVWRAFPLRHSHVCIGWCGSFPAPKFVSDHALLCSFLVGEPLNTGKDASTSVAMESAPYVVMHGVLAVPLCFQLFALQGLDDV